jgi:hypothetical protein
VFHDSIKQSSFEHDFNNEGKTPIKKNMPMFGSNIKISSRKLNLGLDMKDLDTPGYKYGHD